MPTFGEFVKMLRLQNGLTRVQLAAKFGAREQTIANWEKDKYKPSLEGMIRFCNVLGVSLEECAACELLPEPRYIPKLDYKPQLRASLKDLRDMNRMYLSDIGREMYVDPHTAMLWEHGKVPTLDVLLGYCKLFKVTPSQILKGDYPGNLTNYHPPCAHPPPPPKKFAKPIIYILGILFYIGFVAAVIWVFTLIRPRKYRLAVMPIPQYAVMQEITQPAALYKESGGLL